MLINHLTNCFALLFVCVSSQVQYRRVDERQSADNGSVSTDRPTKLHVLEIFTGMGKAIQLLLNQNGIQIATADREDGNSSQALLFQASTLRTNENYKEQAESLRLEIAKRAGTLQKIVITAIDILKERGDVVMRKILENLNQRLEQAKSRADKILKEPATSEMAIKTLNAINQGLSNVNALIQQVLRRVNVRINVDLNRDNQKSGVVNPPTQTPSNTSNF